MHGASGDHGNGGGNSAKTGGKGAAASSPTTVLTKNAKLDTHLTSLLQSKGLLPTGTDLKDACAGFKNLGQCVAAIHVSHNLKIPFACLSADMTGTAPATARPVRLAPVQVRWASQVHPSSFAERQREDRSKVRNKASGCGHQ